LIKSISIESSWAFPWMLLSEILDQGIFAAAVSPWVAHTVLFIFSSWSCDDILISILSPIN
jgi:hypothetical protein